MKIAIVKLSALGDIVHAMVVLQFIKQLNEEILVDWVVDASFKDLLKYNPHINQLHIINLKSAKKNKSILTLFKELKKLRNHETYDLVIDMQGLLKSAIVSKLLPSKQIVGFDKFSIRERFASTFYTNTFRCSYETNVIMRNIGLIEFALGFKIETEQINNKLPYLFSNLKKLDFKLQGSKKNILIIPGASHPSKRFPVSKFAELSKLINATIYVLWGNQEERALALQIKKESPRVIICNKLNLDSLIFLISRLDLVIGPDTGPTHMSWALNIPSITIFGPTPSYRNIFESSKNKSIASQPKVNPFKINKNDFSINNINVLKVVSIAEELLEKY